MIFLICGTVSFALGSIILTSHDLIKSNEVKIIDPSGKEIVPQTPSSRTRAA